jgi:hypothetical protein
MAGSEKTDLLPSWNDGAVKQSILAFVRRVTTEGGPDFVPVPERIAVFDNDGTLWAEQPFYFQGLFVFDRVRALEPKHPDWKDKQPFKAAIGNDMKTLAAGGQPGLAELVMATHAGMTTEEFERTVKDWLATRLGDFMRGFGKIFELLAHYRKYRPPCNRTINRIGGTLDLLDVSIFFLFSRSMAYFLKTRLPKIRE